MKLIGCTPDLSVDNTKLFSWKIEVSDFASEFNGRVSLFLLLFVLFCQTQI